MGFGYDFVHFEHEVINMLLDGKDEDLAILRKQYQKAKIKEREFTGTGFYTFFEIPENQPKLNTFKNFEIGDLIGEIDGVEDGVGFVLFIRNGLIDFLEGYTYGSVKWPKILNKYKLYYNSGDIRNLEKVKYNWK